MKYDNYFLKFCVPHFHITVNSGMTYKLKTNITKNTIAPVYAALFVLSPVSCYASVFLPQTSQDFCQKSDL